MGATRPKGGGSGESPAGPSRSAWVPTALDPRGAAPLRIGEVLVGTQQFVAKQTGALMTHDEWRAIVGEKIASRTRVGRLNRATLTIKVASSAWSNELSFLRSQIISKLIQRGHDVEKLRFVVDQDLLPRRPAPRMGPGKPGGAVPATDLPEELVRRLQQIEDPNLRAAVAEAARVSLARLSRERPR